MEVPLSLAKSDARIPCRAQRDLAAKGEIYFLHPGYNAPNTLSRLARADCENSNGVAVFGLHHATALLACRILANAFDAGCFTLDAAGQDRVDVPLDGLLTRSHYYFFIDGIEKYPVLPSLRDWRFPHEVVEKLWPTLLSNDQSNPAICPLSGSSYAISRAHIVPREEFLWFAKNEISSDGDINNPDNIIPLRKDLRKCFDNRWFVIIPKPTSSGTRYVTHILLPQAAEIWPDYHNIELRCLMEPDGRKILFARFAWTIIQQAKAFLTAGVRREVIRPWTDGLGRPIYAVNGIDGPELQDLYGGGRFKNAPSKRRRSSWNNNDKETYSDNSDNSDTDSDTCSDM